MRVDDTNAQYSAVNIYETMTSVDAGTGASATKYWKKSSTSDINSRSWYAIGNKKVFYFFSDWHSTNTLQPAVYSFGWFPSLKSGDGYNTMLIGHDISTPSGSYANNDFSRINDKLSTEGQAIARSYHQMGGSISFYKLSGIGGSYSYMGNNGNQFPNPVNNGVNLFPVYISESSNDALRGKLPGVFSSYENTAGAFLSRNKDIFMNGKRYIAYRICNSSAANNYCNCWFTLDEEWT